MYNVRDNVQASLGHFRVEEHWFRYSKFVPKLYNWCLELGFEPDKIMPSRAFCSDESQGYPIILLAKHFGTFPFNHGQVGGIMACDRHAPHAHHGKDMVIVHASHVGYDPETWKYGSFLRRQTESGRCSSNCGKIHGTLDWYINEYDFAKNHILIDMRADCCRITIDNKYLSKNTKQGLRLFLDKIVEYHDGEMVPLSIQSTSRTFVATEDFRDHMKWFFAVGSGRQAIGDALLPEHFTFENTLTKSAIEDGSNQLERNLIGAMPWIVTSAEPMLTAAQANTQAEFDRAFRSVSQDPAYKGKNLLYISGLHVDVSPTPRQEFILTKFIPWAAYVQLANGESHLLEQEELYRKLKSMNSENPHQLNFDTAITEMEDAESIYLHLPY